MSDDRYIAATFNDGIDPVVAETPPIPDWESLQFETLDPAERKGQWWVAGIAAALVLLVGSGLFLAAGQLGGGGDDSLPPAADDDFPMVDGPATIAGLWILESWEDGDEQVVVEVGGNTPDEPWIEFTEEFSGERDSFISADGTGTAGSFVAWTGCTLTEPATYEDSGGFLVIEQIDAPAQGCDAAAVEEGLGEAERVMLAMLSNTADGIEVLLGSDRMELHGSNLGGRTYPLVFRREGAVPVPTTTTVAPTEGLAMRVYDVDGIEVVTPSLLPELPEQATQIEFHTMVIDSGNGPELCLGGVQESLPPQCSGPVANGLDMDGWAEESQGVRWGERSVTVSWPPVDGRVEVIEQSPYEPPAIGYPPGDLPAECRDIDLNAGVEAIHQYAQSLGELNGDLYLANDGTLVLQVVGDPEPHRTALAEMGGACVIEVSRSAAEQQSIQQSLYPLLRDALGLLGPYASSTGPGGRLDIYLPVADRGTARLIAGLVDDPTAIRLIGMGVLQP